MNNKIGMNVYTDFKNTPIGFLQDSGDKRIQGKSDFKLAMQMGMLPPQVAYPFLDYKSRVKVMDQMYGPKSSQPVMTDAQINSLVWNTMITDTGMAMHTSGKHGGYHRLV